MATYIYIYMAVRHIYIYMYIINVALLSETAFSRSAVSLFFGVSRVFSSASTKRFHP